MGDIKNVSVEDALKEADNNRVSQNQVIQRGVDTRSGNIVIKEGTTPVITIGVFPDGGYGILLNDGINDRLLIGRQNNGF